MNVDYDQCLCKVGFEGQHCEIVLDPCKDNPCFPGVNCTNNFTIPESPSADCDPCPSGFDGDGRKCFGKNSISVFDEMSSQISLVFQ